MLTRYRENSDVLFMLEQKHSPAPTRTTRPGHKSRMEDQKPEYPTDNPVKKEELDSQWTENSGSHSNNTAGVSNAPQHWLLPDIKQEKEEEEEQSISQRGDLLDFKDQDHYKIKVEENQNPENHTNNPVKREEPGSPSATTDKQWIENSGLHSNYIIGVSNVPQCWLLLEITQEKGEEQSISQRGDLLDFTNPEHCTNNPVKRGEPGSPSATTDKQATKKKAFTTEEAFEMIEASSEDDTDDSEYDSEREAMFAEGRDAILDRSSAEDGGSDWEPDAQPDKHPTPSSADPGKQRRQRSSSAATSADTPAGSPDEDSGSDWESDTRPKRQRLSGFSGSGDATSSTPTPRRSRFRAAKGARGRGQTPRASQCAPLTVTQQWHNVYEEDAAPAPLVFMPVRQPGPQQGTRAARSPLQFFRLFFTDAVLRTLLANTNAYGAKKQKGKRGAWRNITISDMFSFIAMVIYMGLVKCSTLVDFWKGSRLYSLPFPSSVMSRNKFFTICRALHISDIKADEENNAKRGTPGYDRLGKIKPLYKHIVESCKSHFQPRQHISINERMEASKARISLRPYMLAKPNKWGYKLFVLTDSSCGYTWNLYVYDGKSSGSGKGLSYDSVMSLMDFSCLGTGYHLYVDNFYTSSQLFLDLLKKRIGACGTVRTNRVGFPKTKANDFTRGTPRGTIRWIRDSEVLFVKWMDTREVVMCSTIHKAFNGHMTRKTLKKAGKRMQTDIPIPAAVKDYNQHMKGVDMSDALIGYYSVIHKTRKWYRTLFFHFVDIAVVNAHVLHQQTQTESMTLKEFREALVEELAAHGSESTSQASSRRYTAPPNLAASHKLQYFVEGLDVPKRSASTVGRRKCTLCHRKTPVGCVSCDVPLCFVAKRDCFNAWHKQRGL
ncbi:piggyBac transposable element-derived protein 4-like isoform X2 [Thunnus thynnus]|uniref:piggyBac transposable element-derived protein 4-like isoform X2 n=1 Tax=Thunnus thynnus TaxID=8237 RepID=UPI003529952A